MSTRSHSYRHNLVSLCHIYEVLTAKDSLTPSTSSKGDSPTTYADHLRNQRMKYDSSFENAEKLQHLNEALKAKRYQAAGKSGTSSLVSSFPSVKQHMAPLPIVKSLTHTPFYNNHRHEGSHSQILSQPKIYLCQYT